MGETFYSLHDFMLHSKGWTYLLMGLVLVGFLVYWLFLNERDEDIKKH